MVETPSERVAVVVWALAQGQRLTTRQVARLTGMSMRSAYALLCRISRVLPICQDDNWAWSLLQDEQEL